MKLQKARVTTLFALLIFGLSPVSGMAYDATGPWTKVSQIYTRNTGQNPYVYFEAGAMPGCYDDRSGYIIPPAGTDSAQIYSTILSALLADRDIQVFYDYTGNSSGWDMCRIVSVLIS